MPLTPEERTLRARLAAQRRWAAMRAEDRSAATAPARSAAKAKMAPPDYVELGLLSGQARRAGQARTRRPQSVEEASREAVVTALRLAAAIARRRAGELFADAEAAEAELRGSVAGPTLTPLERVAGDLGIAPEVLADSVRRHAPGGLNLAVAADFNLT